MHPATAGLGISVNVSSRQFAQGDLYALVLQVLDETGLPPSRLVLELTETALMENPVTVTDVLSRLRAHGVRVHLDDFGIGYSSLSYLQRFPIDSLKIDRSFTRGVPGKSGDEAIVRAILSLASALNMEVVAEGVETLAQVSHLASLRCGFGQGYLFSRPVESRVLDQLVDRDFLDAQRLPLRAPTPTLHLRRRDGERAARG
jgi:EAL domain-containing protein (putative c-di-GMP-specific phosphodiesterase class I)